MKITCLLGCCAVHAGRSLTTFPSCLLRLWNIFKLKFYHTARRSIPENQVVLKSHPTTHARHLSSFLTLSPGSSLFPDTFLQPCYPVRLLVLHNSQGFNHCIMFLLTPFRIRFTVRHKWDLVCCFTRRKTADYTAIFRRRETFPKLYPLIWPRYSWIV